MAAATPPLSPRTDLRNTIASIHQQSNLETSMCLELAAKTKTLFEEALNEFKAPEIAMMLTSMKALLQTGKERHIHYAMYIGALTGNYVRRGGDIESLANAIFGEAPSEERDAFIADQTPLADMLRRL